MNDKLNTELEILRLITANCCLKELSYSFIYQTFKKHPEFEYTHNFYSCALNFSQ